MNWFIQIAIALEYIHGRKVIHRDIKTSNIFLTGNGTVKLGDFGISKVLENTNEAAMTVVGTPYYMSPEVCESKPYTFKSDVWALGCVLYELCTLQHAFLADNLLGLVFKIVKGNYDAIPSEYSDDLRELVDVILTKDTSKRPTVQEILLAPFLKSKMEEFINNNGNVYLEDLKIKTIKPPPKELTEEEKEAELLKGLTPAQAAKRRKELKSIKEAEKLTNAIKKNANYYGAAKERKYNEFYDSKGGTAMKKTHSETESYGQQKVAEKSRFNQFEIDPNSMTDFSVNDRYDDTYNLSNSMGTEISQLTAKEGSGAHRFSSHDYDDRPVKGKGHYNYEETKGFEDYEDDFEQATRNAEELENVLDNYKRVLSGDITQVAEKSLKKKGGLSPISEVSSTAELDPGTLNKLKDAREKKLVMDYLGEDAYHEVYSYL